MTDEPFGRQPKPVSITITGGDPIDRSQMSAMLSRWLVHRIDLIQNYTTPEGEIINCYPGAVND
jgi:hypothetical protein